MSDQLTERVIAALVEVHRHFGGGLFVEVYREAACHELGTRDIQYERNVDVDIHYRGTKVGEHCMELIVEGKILVELRSDPNLSEAAEAQTRNYMRVAKLKRALLVNFNEERLIDGIKRISL